MLLWRRLKNRKKNGRCRDCILYYKSSSLLWYLNEIDAYLECVLVTTDGYDINAIRPSDMLTHLMGLVYFIAIFCSFIILP